MTREEYNQVVYETLISMGDQADAMNIANDPEWDKEYEEMKHLSVDQLRRICNMGLGLFHRQGKSAMN